MNVKATKDGKIVIVEVEGKKVGVFVTPFGVAVTDGQNSHLEPQLLESEESITEEFGEAGAEYIASGFYQVQQELERQLQAMAEAMFIENDNCITVDGEVVEPTPLIIGEMNDEIDYVFRNELMTKFALEFEGKQFEELDEVLQEAIWRVCIKTPNATLKNNLKTFINTTYRIDDIEDPIAYLMQ